MHDFIRFILVNWDCSRRDVTGLIRLNERSKLTTRVRLH